MSNKAALLVIDAQVNMFAEGSSVFRGEELLDTLSYLIARARAAHMAVVYVQNNGGPDDPDRPGTPGWQIHPRLTPEQGDIVIQKHRPDSFHETNLAAELAARHIRRLIVTGMQTEMCIDATCRRAHELGYDVALVADAHSTFDDRRLLAAEVIAQYNELLAEIITVQEASRLVFE